MSNMARLKKGRFNYMSQKRLPDGTVIITLSKRGDKKLAHFRVKDLYGPNEEEVDLDTGKPIA